LRKVLDQIKTSRPTLVLWILFSAGLALRLVYLASSYPLPLFPDEERFLATAANILHRGEMVWDGRFAWDMPLMPLLTALGLSVSGEHLSIFRMFLIILSSLTIVITARVAYLLSQSQVAMITCAVIMAFYPLFVFFSPLILTETLFLFLFSTFLLLLYRPRSTALFGVAAGLSHLTRPTLIYFLPIIWLWQRFVAKNNTKRVVLGALTFFLVINLWGLRNYSVFGEYFLSTASSGHVLLEGNNYWNDSGGPSGSFSDPTQYKESVPEGEDELAVDRLKKTLAINYIRDNPQRSVILAIKKLGRLWNPIPNSENHRGQLLRAVSVLTTIPLFFLAGISIWILRPIFRKISILYAFILYYSLIHMLTIGSIRYRLPIDVVLIILASLSLSCMYAKLKSRKTL